jgi:type 2A phosphatase activator TIP41
LYRILESPNSRTILINDWDITASTNPISNAFERDRMQDQLAFPLPEMTFGENHLTVQHLSSNWTYSFTAQHALCAVKNGELGEGDGGVKVGYADAWLKSRCVSRSDRSGTSILFTPLLCCAAWILRR